MIGPTLGAVVGVATAIVAVPVGAVTYVVNRFAGRRIMRLPLRTYLGTKSAIPI